MSNRKLGNSFEREVADLLYDSGFWVHLLCQNQDGQPADIIAVKNKRAYLIDCKVCSTKNGFALSRLEENQILAMKLWESCGNGSGWFALKFDEKIIMISLHALLVYKSFRSCIPHSEIDECGTAFERWIKP